MPLHSRANLFKLFDTHFSETAILAVPTNLKSLSRVSLIPPKFPSFQIYTQVPGPRYSSYHTTYYLSIYLSIYYLLHTTEYSCSQRSQLYIHLDD